MCGFAGYIKISNVYYHAKSRNYKKKANTYNAGLKAYEKSTP